MLLSPPHPPRPHGLSGQTDRRLPLDRVRRAAARDRGREVWVQLHGRRTLVIPCPAALPCVFSAAHPLHFRCPSFVFPAAFPCVSRCPSLAFPPPSLVCFPLPFHCPHTLSPSVLKPVLGREQTSLRRPFRPRGVQGQHGAAAPGPVTPKSNMRVLCSFVALRERWLNLIWSFGAAGRGLRRTRR